METEVKFNLQSFLKDMRDEQQSDHRELSDKIDLIFSSLYKHDKRISIVENSRKLVIAVSGALGLAVLGFIFDMAKNHLGK